LQPTQAPWSARGSMRCPPTVRVRVPPLGWHGQPAVTADGEPILPRPGRDDDVDDGLSGIGGEDLSEIPEHMR
jgi:hypothetical protein